MCNHPFISKLYHSFQDDEFLYLLLEYVHGGELYTRIKNETRLPLADVKFYAIELVSALEYLHNMNIVYRDLKPENLMIGRYGHLKLVDFGFAKVVNERTYTHCGTPEFQAPEIIQRAGHGVEADWWSFGALMYELIVGFPAFYADNPMKVYQNITNHTKFAWPSHVDIHPDMKELIDGCCRRDPSKRLTPQQIKRLPLFNDVDWLGVTLERIQPPYVPQISSDADSIYFEDYPELTREVEDESFDDDLFHDF